MTTLVRIIRKFYEENSRYESGPPVRLIKELERGNLVLSDLEISDEDIPVLVRFFNTKQAFEQIKRIEINRSSGGKVNKRRNTSALNVNGHKLFKDLLEFVAKCTSLEILTFEHVELEMPVIFALCKALVSTASPLRWLAFRYCNIGGDEGLKELTPYLGKLQLQVLGLECCNLTDQSLPLITSILKAQENNLDSLYWNATLRLNPAEQNVDTLNEATSFVYSHGLVALSLWGNKITGKSILMLTRLLRKNNWLLGLNLAENNINEINMAILVDELKNNAVLQAVVLRNNDGLDIPLASELCRSVMAKSKDVSSSLSEGFSRLKVLEPRVTWLLNSWMRLQCEETRDLIQGRVLMNYADRSLNKSIPRKPLTKESPQETYLKAYSVFYYLSDPDFKPSLPVHPSGDEDDDDPVLYDFSGDGNARLSLDNQTRSSALGSKHAAERYNTTSTLTVSNVSNTITSYDGEGNNLAATVKRVQEPFHELLFRPSIGSPQPFTHGAEYDESVDASIDHRPSQRLAKARQQADELDRAITIASPTTPTRGSRNHQHRSGDGDVWEYWPDDSNGRRDPERPPSRISIRPKTTGAVDRDSAGRTRSLSRGRQASNFMRPTSPNRRSVSVSRERSDVKVAWEERGKDKSRPASPPRRAWCPSSFVAKASDGTRKNVDPKQATPAITRYSSPAITTRRKSDVPLSGTTYKRVTTPRTKSKKQPQSANYDEITSSVLAATKNLEQVSKRLRDVAETLSESAIMNVSNINIDRTLNDAAAGHPSNYSNPQSSTHKTDYRPNQLFSDQEMENVQFAEVVRQRMKSKLRDYLAKELQSEWD